MRTNILYHYILNLGEQELVKAVKLGQSTQSKSKILPISNPILRFLLITTTLKGKHIHIKKRSSAPDTVSLAIFNATGVLLKQLSDEIKNNPSYQKEIVRDLLSLDEGQALKTFNELLVAGYYKYQGYRVKLSSSAETGMPDVVLLDTPYASDAKTYPNDLWRLRAAINQSREAIEACFKDLNNTNIIVLLQSSDRKKLVFSLGQLKNTLMKGGIYYNDENISASVNLAGPQYPSAHVTLENPTRGVSIYFQASWPMDDSEVLAKKSIVKATSQAKKANKKSIPWMMIPYDADSHAITMQVTRHIGTFEYLFQSHPELKGLVLYSFEPDYKNHRPDGAYIIKAVVDIYKPELNNLDITKEKIHTFLNTLVNIQLVLIG